MSLFSAIKSLFGFSSKTATLQPGDRLLTCEDCHSQFVFDVGEQRFFKEKGFSEPKRCPKCRRKVRFRMRRRGRGHGGGQQQNQNHQHHHQSHQHHNQNQQNQHQGRRNRHQGRRHSVIDGDSPYADER